MLKQDIQNLTAKVCSYLTLDHSLKTLSVAYTSQESNTGQPDYATDQRMAARLDNYQCYASSS